MYYNISVFGLQWLIPYNITKSNPMKGGESVKIWLWPKILSLHGLPFGVPLLMSVSLESRKTDQVGCVRSPYWAHAISETLKYPIIFSGLYYIGFLNIFLFLRVLPELILSLASLFHPIRKTKIISIFPFFVPQVLCTIARRLSPTTRKQTASRQARCGQTRVREDEAARPHCSVRSQLASAPLLCTDCCS